MYKFFTAIPCYPAFINRTDSVQTTFQSGTENKVAAETENSVDVVLDEIVRTRDSEAKRIMKYYGDQRNRAANSNIQVGDTVLMKEIRGSL